MADSSKIIKNSLVYTIVNFSGSLIALAINSVIAAKFGVSYITDGFIIVFGFYQIITILFRNTFGTIFIPHFISIKENYSEKEAWLFTSQVFNNLIIITLIISLIIIFLSRSLVHFIAMGYSSDPLAINYIIRIFRLFVVFFLFSNLSTLCTTVLVAQGKIIHSSFYIIIQNVVPIISAVVYEKKIGISSLIYGYLFGSFINFIVYFTVFLRYKRYVFSFNFTGKQVKNYYKKLLPWFSSNLIVKISPIFERIFASLSVVGGVMFIDFAHKLLLKSVAIVSMGVSISSYADISKYIASEDISELNRLVSYSFKLILLLTIPVLALVIFLREDIAIVLFKYGKMEYETVGKIALAMIAYSLGVFLLNINDLIRKIIFAYKRVLFTSILNVAQLVFNISLIFILIKKFSFMSIPLSYSITVFIVFLSLIIYLKRIERKLRIEDIGPFLLKIISISFIMVSFLFLLSIMLRSYLQVEIRPILNILVSPIFGVVIFILFSKLFRLKEATWIIAKIFERIKRVLIR